MVTFADSSAARLSWRFEVSPAPSEPLCRSDSTPFDEPRHQPATKESRSGRSAGTFHEWVERGKLRAGEEEPPRLPRWRLLGRVSSDCVLNFQSSYAGCGGQARTREQLREPQHASSNLGQAICMAAAVSTHDPAHAILALARAAQWSFCGSDYVRTGSPKPHRFTRARPP